MNQSNRDHIGASQEPRGDIELLHVEDNLLFLIAAGRAEARVGEIEPIRQ